MGRAATMPNMRTRPDYPIGYVRWTEGRNLQSFIDLLAAGKLDVHPLVTHSYSIDQADQPTS